ncbi:PREDICTED: cytochrome P450 CYP749A22-like [Fragaria vesca subsp. vesca]|uniref:cytochrome P450 CYP749A22-like n=1 Tax=Fragaria vesca subsp. vesca TaxID=101020 RepID=UPI0002C2E760|nr:PREDICTED: cytochrome P450 CYP749A22-like [Fragaria vesca subsp. vesca]
MILSFVCVLLLLALINAFHKLWWTPVRLQNMMALQGIKGPSYRLLYGNATEITNMKKEAMSRPISLSHDIFSHVQPHIHAWTKSYGKNFLQWYGVKPVLVVTEPELCKEILNNKDGVYVKPKPSIVVKKLFGDSVAMTEGEKWAKLRKLSNHAFHGESLRNMFPDMIASAEAMVERWKHHEGNEIEVFEEFRLLTSEVISRTAFGSSYLEGKKIFEMLMRLSSIIVRNLFGIRFPGMSKLFRTSDDIESEKVEKGIRNSIMEIVKKREKEAKAGEEDSFGKDFLGLLLKAHHATNDKQMISVDELLEECKTFYFAGQETTNTLLAWTTLLLALHPEWQEEARNEVLQFFGKEPPTYDGIAKLKTMSMIINETLRLYPPAILLARKVSREVRLGKILVPANVELLVPTLALHHEPQLWGEEVELFKPERFSEGIAKATNDNMAAFMPFGLGPRICVGFNFAALEAKIAMSMILQRYSFTLSPGYVHSPFQYVTVRPQNGVQVILHPL